MQLILIIVILFIGGIIGGLCRVLLSNSGFSREKTIKSLGMGVTAAFLVPLFLTFTKSSLLDELGLSPSTRAELCVFAFCITAAIVSKRFVGQVTGHIITQMGS